MTVHKLTTVEGKGTSLDRSEELCQAIKDAVYEVGEGLPISTVIGCLEIAKLEIWRDAE
jgi:hypothetical protein